MTGTEETTEGAAPQPSHDQPSAKTAKPTNPTNNKLKKTKGKPADSPDVTLSKTLSYILRHGAINEKLEIRADGFIRLDELLKRPKMKNNTIEDIKRVVAENEKQRFTIIKEEEVDGTTIRYIRANQGHSLKVERPDLIPVTDQSELPTVVHGTYSKVWDNIVQEGIKPMTRTHIHFSKGLLGEEGVVSGMRASCDIFIYLDVEKCFKDKIEFLISSNGVILSEGLPGSKKITTEYFKKVIKKDGTVLYPLTNHES
ncbi:hypothetical protein Pst134EA_005196 [Puccinia striiformis f. sp. tritici]|uniref:2'-phosphotransferase n=1 Tax=Puccinia striiformis f. sp. tritici PST-78 TaxID=1165861 RepID=A0A0L0VKA3_9BASI|nr:hypothetical protein Pst134EA_005196 [Puccinia striiformis f. sp. tritici]KAH9471292.1 hypothetical protein Pst134EA_005196 [Puccinia striiformis f. sp. tritici]KNE99646.1 hypothetical protein PSTG_07140 [Puccinia striiformis f. sp. tritici PST-78]